MRMRLMLTRLEQGKSLSPFHTDPVQIVIVDCVGVNHPRI